MGGISSMVSDCFFACSSALLIAARKAFAEGGRQFNAA
jgi:hypothetical protein